MEKVWNDLGREESSKLGSSGYYSGLEVEPLTPALNTRGLASCFSFLVVLIKATSDHDELDAIFRVSIAVKAVAAWTPTFSITKF